MSLIPVQARNSFPGIDRRVLTEYRAAVGNNKQGGPKSMPPSELSVKIIRKPANKARFFS